MNNEFLSSLSPEIRVVLAIVIIGISLGAALMTQFQGINRACSLFKRNKRVFAFRILLTILFSTALVSVFWLWSRPPKKKASSYEYRLAIAVDGEIKPLNTATPSAWGNQIDRGTECKALIDGKWQSRKTGSELDHGIAKESDKPGYVEWPASGPGQNTEAFVMFEKDHWSQGIPICSRPEGTIGNSIAVIDRNSGDLKAFYRDEICKTLETPLPDLTNPTITATQTLKPTPAPLPDRTKIELPHEKPTAEVASLCIDSRKSIDLFLNNYLLAINSYNTDRLLALFVNKLRKQPSSRNQIQGEFSEMKKYDMHLRSVSVKTCKELAPLNLQICCVMDYTNETSLQKSMILTKEDGAWKIHSVWEESCPTNGKNE